MKSNTIKQIVFFKASPHEVYEALMDEKKHSRFTNSKCKISRKINGKFTAYDGYIDGINLDLVKDKKIKQKWRGSEWPKNHYSFVIFDLRKVKNGTKLIFTQTKVPEQFYKDISNGWKEHYWENMKLMLEK